MLLAVQEVLAIDPGIRCLINVQQATRSPIHAQLQMSHRSNGITLYLLLHCEQIALPIGSPSASLSCLVRTKTG